jgi:CheY-like chemotaxis protein
MACEFDTHFKVFHELMSKKVMEILLVASPYDAYILEEDGSLASKIINEYRGLNLSRPPRLTRVDDARKALDLLKEEIFDLVITMPHLDDMDSFDLGRAIKQLKPNLPVILLAHTIQGLFPPPASKDTSGIDQVFIWSGDADLLLAIVKSVEDRMNVDNDTDRAQVRVIILAEDSPLYKSYFLPLIYKEVVKQTQAVLEESLNEEHRLLKMRARPKILIAENYEAALALYERYQPFIFGIFSDTRFPKNDDMCPDAGFRLLRRVKQDIPDLPTLLLSSESENSAKAEQIPAVFLDKNSPTLFDELRDFFLNHLGFGDFVFRRPDGKEVGRAANLQQLEALLPRIPDEPLCYHASRNRFSNWIMARSEIALASRLRQFQVSDFSDVEAMRQFIISSIHSLRKWRQKGVVVQFSAKGYDPGIADFVKIGRGSLGGKARGLAFVSNLLRQSPELFKKYKGLEIQIPRSLVITTSGFDAFIETNDLHDLPASGKTDDEITEAFLTATMPSDIEADLAAFLDKVRYPLSVRSSSLLEDAHHQPLAGLYKTFMIANNHADDHVRLDQLIRAIKMVYASTWFAEPQRFARSTAFRHRKEQMAVLVQQIVGRRHGDFFYPVLSGQARSQNYYTFGKIQPNDGMAKIAMGFGRIIDAGEGGLRFCPRYPSILPDFSKTEDILTNAQQQFYALRLSKASDGLIGLERRQTADALEEAPLQVVASTYLPQEDRIRDSMALEGPKLITFASILKHKSFPLTELLMDLLEIGRKGMGCYVDLEFALNLAEGRNHISEFHILQMRPMPTGGPFEVEITPEDINRALCYTDQAMGHGRNNGITEIVYIRPETFDVAHTQKMAEEIRQINARLKLEQKPYLLIGPGRWGSFDNWLGIPVKWDDINGAGAIVELRVSQLKADPSQGSHFFQQITTHGLPYLTITEGGTDLIDWARIQTYPKIYETTFLRHVHLLSPLLIKCDGRSSRCVILPPKA